MKRIFAILLGVCLMLGILPLAYAEDGSGAGEPYDGENTAIEENDIVEVIPPQEENPVKVSSYEELEAAVVGAEDGDIIEISKPISIGEGKIIETEKDITLRRADDFTPIIPLYREMFAVWGGGTLKGFNIVDTSECDRTIELKGNSKIIDCYFDGKNVHNADFLVVMPGTNAEDKAIISNCTFTRGCTGVYVIFGANAICKSCTSIKNNQTGINNNGNLELVDCTVTENGIGGIRGFGTITLTNCKVYSNILADPANGVGTDLCYSGTLIITDISGDENAWYYDEFTGDKIELPYRNEGATRLIYLQVDEADEYFAAKFPPKEPEEENPPENDDINQPSEGTEDKDDTTDKPQDDSNTENPPQNDTTDKPADDTQQKPQEPTDGGGGRDDDYIPPIDYKPSKRPTKPSVNIEQSKPQEDPDVATLDQSPLICNDAVIDVNRTIVLLGYGDGLIHEDDYLTRAQLATIIYRLLDDKSITKYSNAELTFADVAADAWFAPYVKIMRAAGIINGVGNGKYDPNGKVTWAQTITILSRFVEAQEVELQNIQYDGWATPALTTAVAMGWIKDSVTFNPNFLISRGELVEFINSVLALYQ